MAKHPAWKATRYACWMPNGSISTWGKARHVPLSGGMLSVLSQVPRWRRKRQPRPMDLSVGRGVYADKAAPRMMCTQRFTNQMN